MTSVRMRISGIRLSALNAVLSLLSIVLALALIEAIILGYTYFQKTVRIDSSDRLQEDEVFVFARYHPILGWDGIPNVRKYFEETLVTLNGRGNRGPDFPFSKSPGTKRVVFIGDSQVWGYGVNDNETIPHKLNELLFQATTQKFEVINLGVGGYGTDQEFLKFLIQGIRYSPDWVILIYFHENDIQETESNSFWGVEKPRFFFDNGALCLTNVPPKPHALWKTDVNLAASPTRVISSIIKGEISTLVSRVQDRFRIYLTLLSSTSRPSDDLPADVKKYIPCISKDSESKTNGKQMVLTLITTMQSIQKNEGGRFMVVMVPNRNDYAFSTSDNRYQDIAQNFQEQGITFIDMLSLGLERNISVNDLFGGCKDKRHLSVLGSELVAQEIGNIIVP